MDLCMGEGGGGGVWLWGGSRGVGLVWVSQSFVGRVDLGIFFNLILGLNYFNIWLQKDIYKQLFFIFLIIHINH